MIVLDGSQGEGGGQILRTALTLSAITGNPVTITNIRANRSRPGLQPQHLAAVKAIAEVVQARLDGAELHSGTLVFIPTTPPRAGEYRFDVGTAGSCTLVVQTVLPSLLMAGGPSQLTVLGGTHNMMAPPYEFLAQSYLPLVARLGPSFQPKLIRPGFYPVGGGQLSIGIQPAELGTLELPERGRLGRHRAIAVLSNLPDHIAQRELKVVARELGWSEKMLETKNVSGAKGSGNVLILELEFEHVTEIFVGFGARGVKAEAVAGSAIREAKDYLGSTAAVGPHLADQLLLPLALADGGRYTASEVTLHTRTNIDVIRQFLEVEIDVEKLDNACWQIEVRSETK